MKFKNFCSVKDLVKVMERKGIHWENIFKPHIWHWTDIRICKELSKLSNKKVQLENGQTI